MKIRNYKIGAHLAYLVEALGAALLFFVCALLGLDRSSRMGGWLGERIGPKLSRHHIARGNIERAMPELNEEERNKVLKAMWGNFGRTIAEYPHLAKFQKPKYRSRIEFVYSPKAKEAMEKHKGRVFFFSGHFTNWEVMPLVMRFANIESAEVYQRLSNPYINYWLSRVRMKAICSHQIEKSQSVRSLVRYIKGSFPFTALTDQKMMTGEWGFFFQQLSIGSKFPATLAVKHNYALVPAHIERVGTSKKVQFRITINHPLELDPKNRTRKKRYVQYVSQQITYCLEVMIRAQPENWLWTHDRWEMNVGHKIQAHRHLNSLQ